MCYRKDVLCITGAVVYVEGHWALRLMSFTGTITIESKRHDRLWCNVPNLFSHGEILLQEIAQSHRILTY